jgi:hypothetical protein
MPYLRETIEDEGIEVGISEHLILDKLAIVKVDDYYAGLHLAAPPKAIDYLVVVDCECNSFVMYLLELKNVNSPKFLDIKAIHEKFDNTISDFLSKRFAGIFMNDSFKYKEILLYLVSDAYGLCGKYESYNEYRNFRERINKRDSLKTEMNLGNKMFRFRGKILKISYDMPPNPIIKRIS